MADMLAIPASEWDARQPLAASESADWVPSAFELSPGDHIVLTGEMSVDRSEWESRLRSVGYVPHPRVTKKTRLLVAADPDSLSGKAQQARKYGIPVVGEEWLEEHVVQGSSWPHSG